jgi:DNA-binding beta-propeller fold protein YncE
VSEDSPIRPRGYAPGSRIAGYLLQEQIGQGGMAVVFRAHDERLDRQVALKILAPALAEDDAFRQRFIRESRAAAAVDDPHIIPVFEAGEAGGVLFIAMRFVRGGDVRSLVSQLGPLPPGRAAEIISQAASALDAAHQRGLVHRDVKPANMLLDGSSGAGRPDHVYLSDFGLSKGSLQTSGLTGTGQFLGTLDYIAPEQIEGKPVDGRADEYALACAAFELLTGVPPFRRDEAMAVMYAQLSEPPPALTSRRPDLPQAADAVFARALAKAPADRYRSCREFADALREAFGIRPYDSGPGVTPAHDPTQLAAWQPGSGPGALAGGGQQPSGQVPAAYGAPGQAPPGYGQHAGQAPPGYGQHGQQASEQAPAGRGVRAGAVPTELVGRPTPTKPGLTEHGYGSPSWPTGPEGPFGRPHQAPSRPAWRSPAALVGGIVVLLAAAGGGAFLALKNHGTSTSGGGGNNGGKHVVALTVPPCSTNTASPSGLTARHRFVPVPSGNPFGMLLSKDGKTAFAVTPTNLEVFGTGPGLALTSRFSYTIANKPFVAKGIAMTPDGKHLLVAAGNGIDVFSEPEAEAGASTASETTLTVPGLAGYAGAVEVATSPDGHFAFLTLQFANKLAVFDLSKALGGNPGGAFVGTLRLKPQPVGMAVSPDGQRLYVASFGWQNPPASSGVGVISVLSMPKLEAGQLHAAKMGVVAAGCSAARVVAAQDGTVWVTARESNYLLGFSAAKMLSDPAHALIAKVQVGANPIGAVLVDNGAKMIVADTDTHNTGQNNLAVVNLSGTPALAGFVKTGLQPREFAVGGHYLYVSDNGSAQIQVIDLNSLH